MFDLDEEWDDEEYDRDCHLIRELDDEHDLAADLERQVEATHRGERHNPETKTKTIHQCDLIHVKMCAWSE